MYSRTIKKLQFAIAYIQGLDDRVLDEIEEALQEAVDILTNVNEGIVTKRESGLISSHHEARAKLGLKDDVKETTD